MNVKELMIRDWVRYSPESISMNKNYGGLYRVESVSQNTISLGAKNYQLVVPDKEIYFITLTTEILEKNGWRRDSTNDMFEIWIHEDVEFYIEKWNGIFICGDITQIKLYSVHQLQQTLRLCGLNDLADNFKV